MLEPTHSKFGFALNDDTSNSSVEDFNGAIGVEEEDKEQEATMSTDRFTKRMRKQLEKLLVFYDGENENQVNPGTKVFTNKELLVLR